MQRTILPALRATDCPDCQGDGFLVCMNNISPFEHAIKCEACNGTGVVEVCPHCRQIPRGDDCGCVALSSAA
jgi:DnaJ-class molecular chaperone